MTAQRNRRLATALGAILASGFLCWRLAVAENAPAAADKSPAAALTETLGGADRYQTHLSTDKPIYRTGETLLVRGVLLHHATHQPLGTDKQVTAIIEIKGPKGDSVASGVSRSEASVLGFQWAIPSAQAGGEYTIHVSYPDMGYAPAERKFDIRAYRAPRLKTQIKFLRDGYGPGDEVVALLHAERAEGGIPASSAVTVIARVDGEESYRGSAKIDDKGNCQVRFKLPAAMKRGDGTLALVIEDGGAVETAAKTIPILLQTVDLTLYPEGGDLVAGLANRVYFEAFTPAKKPADVAGVVVDEQGREVAAFKSEHEGRGRFSFTPKSGGKYALKITEPAGIKSPYPLPEVKTSGVVLSSTDEVTSREKSVRLSLAATAAGKYRVVLRQRDIEIASVAVDLAAGRSKDIVLSPASGEGVLMATAYSSEGKPLAERLVFRQPARSVRVKLAPNAKQYIPGGKASIGIQTVDETDKPISAVVGVAVTDDSVLEMMDKREQAPRLPVMVLLEGDVKELADAHVYLDPANPKANLAVDLLLGTQGWRRFALADPAKFMAEHGPAARRALSLRMATFAEKADFSPRDRFRFAVPGEDRPVDALAPEARKDGAAAPLLPAKNEADGKQQAQENAREEAKKEVAAGARALEFGEEGENDARRKLRAALDEADQKAFGGGGGGLGRGRRAGGQAIRNDFPHVRIYAHQVRSQRQPGERTDFAETLFWSAGIRTDAEGKANVEFGLNDSVTSFRVSADAFSDSGALGQSSLAIESVEPFYLEPKLPLEVTSGDKIRLPLGLVNSTPTAQAAASLKYELKGEVLLDSGAEKFNLPASGRLRKFLDIEVGKHVGPSQLTIHASAGPFADKVTRPLMVRPLGFPQLIARGGLLVPDGQVNHEVVVPATLVPGSLEAKIVVYPTPLASLTNALAALIQEPCGCFEQTSSTVYPLVMAQQYFMSHQGVDPALIEKSGLILETGYQRLRGFESPSGGFEWFGGDPGHDALTAYGLMEFTDMEKVRFVDPVMLERTRKWLVAQRDGNGGYVRKTHTLHTWVADPECANTYNTWALLESGVKSDLATEVKWAREAGEKAQNTYAVALAANVMALAGDKDGKNHLLDKLAGKQQADGSLKDATTSVIGSGGEALAIETTALAVLAWLNNKSYTANVEKSIEYLAKCCKDGRFGSTQSTILALKAIVAYDRSRAKPTTPGSLQLVVDGKFVGTPVAFDQNTTGAIELPVGAELFAPGKHQVEVRMGAGSQMPYSVAVKFNSLKPDSSELCKLHLEAKLKNAQMDEGAATEADVVVVNKTGETIPMPIAIIGIPGGLEVRHDQLKELVKAKKIDAYEVLGREVVLYWRSLAKETRVDVSLSLIAAVPGTYTGPASRAYLYYTDEHKQWVDGMKVEIQPKDR